MRHFNQFFPMRNGYLIFICYFCGIKLHRTMKKSILTLIVLATALTAMAQATQPCEAAEDATGWRTGGGERSTDCHIRCKWRTVLAVCHAEAGRQGAFPCCDEGGV